MAFKNLSNEEMTAVSEAWVTPNNAAHKAMQPIDRLVGLLPVVRARHFALSSVLAAQREDDDKAANVQRATELDTEHDTLATAVYGYLSAVARMNPDGESLIALRDKLMPDGVGKVVHATYRGQAGFVANLRARLDDATRAQLEALVLPDGTLLDKVEAWMAAGESLGALEEERSRAEAERIRNDSTQVIEARNAWVGMANALVAVAALGPLDREQEDLIFSPLRDAEKTADLRAARHALATDRRRTPTVSDVVPGPNASQQDDHDALTG